MTTGATLFVDDNDKPTDVGNYVNITGTGTTLVKTGAGFLYSVTFNKPVATGTVEFDDALTNTTPKIGTITVPANPQPVTIIYNVAFSTGLSITVGTAAQDLTVVYR